MAAMAGDDNHLYSGSLDLFHLFSAIKKSFFIIPGDQGAAPAAAAILPHFRWIQIHPLFKALIQNPAGFIKKTMPEKLLCLSSIVAGIVISRFYRYLCFIQFDLAISNVLDQQIKYRIGSKFPQYFRIPFFETRPGRKIGMPSFRPKQILCLELLHIFCNPAGHDLHSFIIPGKQTPIRSFPIGGRNRPIFFSREKNFPPVF